MLKIPVKRILLVAATASSVAAMVAPQAASAAEVRCRGGSSCETASLQASRVTRVVRHAASAHGVFNVRHRDGRLRSGVLLSDGLLITAAEIEAMESVPELVVLNCCHLGQVDLVSDGNRLAASIARELIDIGVRCVIVAGWAVNDEGASLFGQTFYQNLLLQKLSFGEAVFEARQLGLLRN